MVLGIYGYGGHGLEVEEVARVINEKENRWEKVLFIDDATEKTDGERRQKANTEHQRLSL